MYPSCANLTSGGFPTLGSTESRMASRADGGISGTKSNSLCRPLVVVRDKGMDRDVQLAAPFEKAQFDNKRRGDDIRADAA